MFVPIWNLTGGPTARDRPLPSQLWSISRGQWFSTFHNVEWPPFMDMYSCVCNFGTPGGDIWMEIAVLAHMVISRELHSKSVKTYMCIIWQVLVTLLFLLQIWHHDNCWLSVFYVHENDDDGEDHNGDHVKETHTLISAFFNRFTTQILWIDLKSFW